MISVGFGRSISWEDDATMPSGHQMTFKDALHVVSSDIFLKLIVPNWALGLTERTRKVRLAFNELQVPVRETCDALTLTYDC